MGIPNLVGVREMDLSCVDGDDVWAEG